MAIIAKKSGDSGRSFEPAPEGVHQAVCVDVIDLGMLDVTWQGVTTKKHKISLAWQIAEPREDGKPFLVFKRYTVSLHEKSGLRKDLESWLGRKFGRDEELGFDVESVLGRNCLLNITHRQTGEVTYANVTSVTPLMKGMPPITVRDYVRKVDRTETTEQTETPSNVYPIRANESDEPPPLTDDDIRWTWLLPFMLPLTALASVVLA